MPNSKSIEISKLTKWLCYTVIIGSTPIGLRLLFSSFIQGISPINPADFIALGFVLHISIINELEHISNDQTWKTISNTGSIIAIFLYGGLTCLLLTIESGNKSINIEKLTSTSMILATCSFILCFVIFHRLSSKEKIAFKLKTEGTVIC